MSLSGRVGIRRPATIVLAGAATLALSAAAIGSAQASPVSAQTGPTALYIVQMAGDPIATYAGGVAGYSATKPAAGQKLDAHSSKAKAYGDHLKSTQTTVLHNNGVDAAKTVYQYAATFNGVAVNLTAAQAQKLQHAPGVMAVFKNRTVTIDTPPTPDFVGLTGAAGVWKKQFGGDANAGNGVIIGDIDTGFWPESPSFAPLPSPRSDDATIAAKFHGICQANPALPASSNVTCNNKVIGARYFDAAGNSNANPGEFKSPRDFDGHGSHTASTAAGEHVSNVTVDGSNIGEVEGMAPGARLSIYKVLYENASASTAQGSDVDIVAAIDAAVSDGVDVINFSVGDNVDTFGPDELAFLNAAAAGVFVSAAAGNAGPGASTVDNAMPWETTVAAGSYSPAYLRTITLGNGAKYTGVGVGNGVGTSPLIDAADPAAVNTGATAANAQLCKIGALNPATVAGKIVICRRGVNARVEKSKAVLQAGGVGMIMYNPSPNSLDADFHSVPTAAVDTPTGTAVKAYAASAGAGATASLSAGTLSTVEAPAVAGFSSRGPALSSGGDLLKPDIMAPGINVIAAVSPKNHNNRLYDNESGTSMATPHIAGIAALIMSKHPDWSPMWVKSAIMTNATTLDNQNKPIAGTPLDYGSGEVVPGSAFDPGLVYDSGIVDWLQYSCGIGVHLFTSSGDVCNQVGAIAPNQLNYPSISFGALPGTDTVTRTVTNTAKSAGVYFPDVKAPAGYTVTVSPKVLIVPPGKKATFKVTVTRTTAGFGTYSFGSLTWRDPLGHKVYSPIAVQAAPLSAPGEVSGSGTSGSSAIALKAGYAGTLTASASGLVVDTVNHFSLSGDPTKPFDANNPQTSDRTARIDVTVPAGAKLARFNTFASDYATGTDVDLYAYATQNGEPVAFAGQSAGGTADESITLTDPGTYAIYIDLFNNPSANPLDVQLHSWTVTAGSAGNFSVSPASQSVTLGGAATVTASWTGLTAGRHYLGIVEYGDGTNVLDQTVVSVSS